MREYTKPKKVKLFFGVIYPNQEIFERFKKILTDRFGEIDTESEEYPFSDLTDYYEEEIGPGLNKRLLVFNDLIDREDIVDIKIWSNKIEDETAVDDKRIVNLDPGYITEINVILPTIKDRPQKIYIGKGIFGHVVLVYADNIYHTFRHSFHDFKLEEIQRFLLGVRKDYLKQLKMSP